ncbi:unnamed protein product [Onchocerca ochengi]|uniref:Ovule protein n=2 Tax=Onchocerca TaxID=6281 RepID=A0A182E1B3_ONCOC|nr:unnamed protein product [Onchocerca ochengi]
MPPVISDLNGLSKVLHAQISSSSSNQFKSLASAYRTKQYCNDGMHDGMDGCNNFPEGGMDRKPTRLLAHPDDKFLKPNICSSYPESSPSTLSQQTG